MYDRTVRSASVRRRSGQRGRRREESRRERVLMAQLGICLVLFLTVFVGKGVFPGRLVQLRGDIFQLITADFDFQGALSQLGESMAGSGTVLEGIGDFCIQVFGPREEAQPVEFQPPQPAAVLTAELGFLSGAPSAVERATHYTDAEAFGLRFSGEVSGQKADGESAPETAAPEEPEVLPAGTVVEISDYEGPDLPNNYTMDRLSLGGLDTTVPVLGRLNSEYGYRTHPVNGEKGDFHGGVDIGGQEGDPIAAFAGGVVEYTGQDDSYGMYLQVDHGNGVKSFYAHCSQVLVQKGQSVAKGETIALVGSTGMATGPHLHLELTYGKMHLNPAYYVEFLQEG